MKSNQLLKRIFNHTLLIRDQWLFYADYESAAFLITQTPTNFY